MVQFTMFESSIERLLLKISLHAVKMSQHQIVISEESNSVGHVLKGREFSIKSSCISVVTFTPTYTRLNSRINALAHKCYLTGCLITARPMVLWCYTTCPAAQAAREHKTPLCHYKLYTFAHLSCSLHKSQTASDCCAKHTCPDTQLHRNKTGTPQKTVT